MNYWKEKVADKLSRLLADSPTSSSHFAGESPTSSSHFARESPTLRPETQAIPFPTESFLVPSTPTVSSVLLSFLPNVSPRSNGHKGSKSAEQHKDSSSWFRPVSSKSWKFKKLPDEESAGDNSHTSVNECARNGTPDACEGVHNDCQGDPNIFDDTNETSTSENISNSLSNLMDQSSFISADLYEFLDSSIPIIVKGCQWVLLYRAVH